jgi:antitoxin (DNA-binding transcriptional repressor) of toxin-antitoxin stability system
LARYSIAEASEHLPRLIEAALAGEDVTITRDGKPVVELKPSASTAAAPPSELVKEATEGAQDRPQLVEPAVDIVRRMRDERELALAAGILAPARMFARYVGVDYSGAGTPLSRLTGIRVYAADGRCQPTEILPASAGRWSRRDLAEWLIKELESGPATLVGIDHAFSFPLSYFDKHGLDRNWPSFLDDFRHHWPTDESGKTVTSLLDASARKGESKWRRRTDERASGAKSVFHFGVPGSVAHSTHAGLPWLLAIRQRLGAKVHFWPFDGWTIPAGRSVVAEVYPALWKEDVPLKGLNPHQQDAYRVAAWMAGADRSGQLDQHFHPELTDDERTAAIVEGWIFGA